MSYGQGPTISAVDSYDSATNVLSCDRSWVTTASQPNGIWQARLKINGKARHKSFSVLLHGWQNAYEQAVAAREQLLAKANDKPYLYDKLATELAAKANVSTNQRA